MFLPVLLLTYPEFKMYVYYVERKKKVDIYTMLSPIQNSFNLSLFSRYILSPKIQFEHQQIDIIVSNTNLYKL